MTNQIETKQHEEVEDEYELSLKEDVEDEATLDDAGTRHFSITSYGADYTVDSLVKRMKGGAFIIPEFQRKFVWSQRHASKFIESLLMGLPVPGIFLYKQAETNKHLVIDGQQRLTSLRAFYEGLFGERKFKLVGVRQPWADKTYADLDPSDQLKLDDSIVHATIFQQEHAKDVLDSIYFVFERINSGGIRLSPQEIRNCVSHGSFLDLIKELNANGEWRAIYGPISRRLKDQELILRFLALYKRSSEYARPLAGFLNDFTEEHMNVDASKLGELRSAFVDTISAVRRGIGEKAFRPIRAFNTAVFDSVMVGLARRVAQSPPPPPEKITEAYNLLLQNKAYQEFCARSTADEDFVKKRIAAATEAFAQL
jgi:hypothetical protein